MDNIHELIYNINMYSIVVIDDESEHLHGIADFFPFEEEGFFIKGMYEDGKEGLKAIKELMPDVVFTDIMMPEITGLDIAKELAKEPNPPVVCIISAYDDFEYAREALRAGVTEYLTKPTSFDDIRAILRKIKLKLDGKMVVSDESASLIDKALHIMENDLRNASLKSVADELKINISYLSRLFKEKTGENFQNKLLSIKIEKAKELLSGYERYTNDAIARALGYQDTQNFCRTFKRIVGVSPQSFRKDIANEEN